MRIGRSAVNACARQPPASEPLVHHWSQFNVGLEYADRCDVGVTMAQKVYRENRIENLQGAHSDLKPCFPLFPAIALTILAACFATSGQIKFDTSKTPGDRPVTPAPAPAEKPVFEAIGIAVDSNKYLIGPEDVLFIKTWREPDFTLPVVVRPDGKITMPLIGELSASDLTPQQLTTNIKEQLNKYLTNPDVSIFVQDVRSKKYYIDGEVNRPGSYPLITPTRILETLSNAGGFKDFANIKDIRILRADRVLHFNYKDVTRGKHLEQNVYVENGDHVIVH